MNPNKNASELEEAVRSLAPFYRRAFGFALAGGLLVLAPTLYMLEVYDRVLPSRSIPTLVVLSILALLLFASQGVFDVIRSRILVRIGSHIDDASSERVFDVGKGATHLLHEECVLLSRQSFLLSPLNLRHS